MDSFAPKSGLFHRNRCKAKVLHQKSITRIIHQPEKLAKEGTLGLRMILRPVVSQEHRDPKTSASGLPGTAQIGLIVALRRTSSWQPFGAYNQLFALEPVTLFTALYRTG